MHHCDNVSNKVTSRICVGRGRGAEVDWKGNLVWCLNEDSPNSTSTKRQKKKTFLKS